MTFSQFLTQHHTKTFHSYFRSNEGNIFLKSEKKLSFISGHDLPLYVLISEFWDLNEWKCLIFPGKGVNIILDPVGASYWEKNVNSLSVDGRWILYGLMGGAKIDGPLFGKLLMKRIQLLASTLRARSLDVSDIYRIFPMYLLE